MIKGLTPRRVVTGHDQNGDSYVTHDGVGPPRNVRRERPKSARARFSTCWPASAPAWPHIMGAHTSTFTTDLPDPGWKLSNDRLTHPRGGPQAEGPGMFDWWQEQRAGSFDSQHSQDNVGAPQVLAPPQGGHKFRCVHVPGAGAWLLRQVLLLLLLPVLTSSSFYLPLPRTYTALWVFQ